MSTQKQLWTVSSAQGERHSQEDAHFFLETPHGWTAGLFDGHGGGDGSVEATQLFVEELSRYQGYPLSDEYLTDLFRRVHRKLVGCQGGTTALIVNRFKKEFICACAGDSECIIPSEDSALIINEPHRVTNEVELERIQQAGGFIRGMHVAHPTSGHGLMPTRTLNDGGWEPVGVIPDPEIIRFTNELKAKYICLVCDGVWEKLTPTAISTIASGKRSPATLAEALVRSALTQGSRDNCTALVVRL